MRIVHTEWCEVPRFQYLVSGILHMKKEDGTKFDLKEGDVSFLPSSRDAWVVGNEPAVLIDWHGASNCAKK
jgi:uncharacterized cupin superfamily protein